MEEVEKKDESIATSKDEPTIINTENGIKNGQDKCPKCGSTDISSVSGKDTLRCNFCRY